jgi:hypothetical protein
MNMNKQIALTLALQNYYHNFVQFRRLKNVVDSNFTATKT